jgi:hypothetical protein
VDVGCLELGAVRVEFRNLRRSSGCPIERMKGDQHVSFPSKVSQPHSGSLFANDGGQIEVRSEISGFQGHALIPA